MNCRKLNIPQRGEDITTDEELDAAFERAKIHEKNQRNTWSKVKAGDTLHIFNQDWIYRGSATVLKVNDDGFCFDCIPAGTTQNDYLLTQDQYDKMWADQIAASKAWREAHPPVYPTNAPFEMFKGLSQ